MSDDPPELFPASDFPPLSSESRRLLDSALIQPSHWAIYAVREHRLNGRHVG